MNILIISSVKIQKNITKKTAAEKKSAAAFILMNYGLFQGVASLKIFQKSSKNLYHSRLKS